MRKNVGRHRLLLGVGASAAISALVLLASCTANNDAPIAQGGGGGTPTGIACTTPQQGCPCETGATAECAQSTTGANNFIMCAHGTRSCTNSAWGACNLNGTLSNLSIGPISVAGGLEMRGLGGATLCTANADVDAGAEAGITTYGDPCDPYCNIFPDTASGIGGDGGDDSGLVAVDGGAIRAAGCGDSHLTGTEECDDGNLTDGDGCSHVCALELDYICLLPGLPCTPTICGNGIRVGGEECDDGNNQPYDGCSAKCEIEPICPPGGCNSRCGDGLKFPSEDCDDGNTRNGDGCSSSCHIESGATCTTTTGAPPSSLTVPIVYRDFKGADELGGNPDFEKNPICGSVSGIMANNLDASQRPVRGGYTGACVTNTTSWSQWYSNVPLINKTVSSSLNLGLISPTPATYQFASNNFFPLDGNPSGWGNYEASGHDFGFTSELRFPFTYAGGEVLSFVGDDDVFVFINDKLAVDLGGVHPAEGGSITLSNTANNRNQNGAISTISMGASGLNLNVGTTYQIVVFQAERHTVGSNYTLTLSGFDHTVSTCTAAQQKTTLYRDYCASSDPNDTCPPDSSLACPIGTTPVWQTFQWQAKVPAGTEIDFSAATAPDISTLPTTPPSSPAGVAIGSATPINSPAAGPETWQNLVDAANKPVPVSAQLDTVGQKSQKWLRVYITFVTTGGASPNLDQWHQFFDCVPNE